MKWSIGFRLWDIVGMVDRDDGAIEEGEFGRGEAASGAKRGRVEAELAELRL